MKTKTKKKIPTFTISRRRWYRGHGDSDSRLQLPRGGACCFFGLIALQIGYASSDIRGIGTPDGVEHPSRFREIGLVKFYPAAGRQCNLPVTEEMMKANDDPHMTDPERERKLRELATGHFKLRFVA